MPDGQDPVPSPESKEIFLDYVSGKQHVHSVEEVAPQVFAIVRNAMTDLKVYLTNIYIVGEADLYRITSRHDGIDAIVTVSAWNSYTASAKESARSMGVGLFELREFMGAIYYDGARFLKYVHPEKRERSRPRPGKL